MRKFSDKQNKVISSLVYDLENAPNEYSSYIINNWFKKHFEEFHIETSIDNELMRKVRNNSEEIEYHQKKSAIYKIAEGLIERNIPITETENMEYISRTDYYEQDITKHDLYSQSITKTRYSMLVLKNK